MVIVAAESITGPPGGTALITADGAGDGGGGVAIVISQSPKPSSLMLRALNPFIGEDGRTVDLGP